MIVACGYFVPPLASIVESLNEFHFQGIVFAYLVIVMLVMGEIRPQAMSSQQEEAAPIDMAPWRYAKPAGLVQLALVLTIYVLFADLSALET